jgi:hypothetical protein
MRDQHQQQDAAGDRHAGDGAEQPAGDQAAEGRREEPEGIALDYPALGRASL